MSIARITQVAIGVLAAVGAGRILFSCSKEPQPYVDPLGPMAQNPAATNRDPCESDQQKTNSIKTPSEISRSNSYVTIAASTIKGIKATEPPYWACLAPINGKDKKPGECDPYTITQILPDFSSGTPPYVPTADKKIPIPQAMQGKAVGVKVGGLLDLACANRIWRVDNEFVILNPKFMK